MADVIKDASDFPLGWDLSQFLGELQALSLTVSVTDIRTDGDTMTIELSGTPSGADSAAIDAAVLTHDPSVETAQEVAEAQREVFGSAYTYVEQESIRVRVDDNWQEVNTLDIPELEEEGIYRIAWFYEWGCDTTSEDFVLRVQIDDSTELSMHQQEPKDSGGESISGSGTNQRHVASGFRHMTLTAGSTPNIDIDIKGEDDNYEVTVYRSRIEFWRVK